MSRTSIAYWLLLSAGIGCSAESGAGDPASVGVGGTATTPGVGGAPISNAGSSSVGGGSTQATGGIANVTTGGSSNTGFGDAASVATGGSISGLGGAGNGGTPNAAGGNAATGGTKANVNGGDPAAGGSTSKGGTNSTGGKASGGTTSKGGSASGGSSTTGGSSASTGGNTASGGKVGSGGSATGGVGTGTAGTGATGGDPPTGTMRIFYLRPSDVPLDQRYPDGIGKVMIEAQTFFQQQLGKTFKLNNPIVEVVVGEHERSWYENTSNGGDKYWWSAANAQQEIARRFHLTIPDPRWMVVSEVSAEGTGAGGGATGGWVLLPGHDADGGAGYPTDKARWVGGMVHELGHAFGLPDSTSTDGTCMSASFYGWPNCTFTQSMKDKMLAGRWGTGKFLF